MAVEKCISSETGLFTLCKVTIEKPDVIITEYVIRSNKEADDFVVRIDFGYSHGFEHDYNKVEISHGFRSRGETLEETARYIEILQEALNFVPKAKQYALDHPVKYRVPLNTEEE